MRRPGGGVLCILAVLFLTGCTHVSGVTDFFGNTFSFLHGGKPPAEDHQAKVCMLDPAMYAAQLSDQPAPASDLSPVVEIPEATYDFGAYGSKRELVHKFTIKNTGQSVLNIKKVLPG